MGKEEVIVDEYLINQNVINHYIVLGFLLIPIKRFFRPVKHYKISWHHCPEP